MNVLLNQILVLNRTAELHHASDHTRFATRVPARRRSLRDQNTHSRPSAEPRRGTTALAVEPAIGSER